MKYTNPFEPKEYEADIKQYFDAMSAWEGDGYETCSAIEKKHELYGYPPAIVSEVLAAGSRGEDVIAAEDKAIGA